MPKSDDLAGRTLSVDGLCGGNDEKSKNLFALYKAASTRSFEFGGFIGMHKLGKNAWKLDILDNTFSIVEEVVTDDLIPRHVVNRFREFFVNKLAKVWENSKEEDDKFSLSDREYSGLMRLIKYCRQKSDWTTV